ncbi:hypothetical protein GN138_15565, partial [Winogradskyella sp. HL2-2]|nr:hypothetical protein [Winogradskyella endarachnes]
MKSRLYILIFICFFFYSNFVIAQLSCTNTWEQLEFDDYEDGDFDPAIVTSNSYSSGYPNSHGAYNSNFGVYLNIINGVPPGSLLYDREFVVCQDTPLRVSMWMSTRYGGAQCNMTYNIVDENSNIISTWTGDIPYANQSGWTYWTSDLFITTGSTVRFQIFNNVTGGGGNDFAFDDLLLEACATDSSLTLTPSCDSATASISGDEGGTFSFNPVPTDGATIDAITGEITNGTPSATYTVEYYLCPSLTTESVTLLDSDDPTFIVLENCEGGTVTIMGDTGGVFAFNPIPTDAANIDATTGEVTNGTPGATYTIQYTTSGTCPQSSFQNVTVFPEEDATFTLTPSCNGATATPTVAGGTFSFSPTPTDGALIDSSTGTVSNALPNSTYTIQYTTNGACPETVTQDFTTLPEDNSSFTIAPTCDGGIATLTGLAGGTFGFSSVPTDGAVIDVNTGLVTDGVPGETYTVEYLTNGDCPTTTVISFTANPLPNIVDPTALEVCDDGTPDGLTEMDLSIKNSEITGGNPEYAVSYYFDYADAESGTDALPILYTNTSNGQIIHVRVENINTGCVSYTTLELIVQQAPVANQPSALEYCDPDSDGFGEFDLTSRDDEITGGDSTLTVSYHETMSDADNNVNPIASPYYNIVQDNQTIYVRVESATIATDCDTIVSLELIVNPTPQLGDMPVEPLEVCDDISADGFAQFDLTSKIPEILQNLTDSSLYTVSFYLDETNAEDATNAITNTTNYTNSTAFNQELWVRVEDNNSGCYKITTLDLVVNPIPVLEQSSPLELCDYNNPGDEQEAFILEDANAEILNGQTGVILTFYETQNDLDFGTNPLISPYTNISNPQTVFVKATNSETGCSNTSLLTLRVNPIPSPTTPVDLEVCDDDTDGFASFNLEDRTQEIIGGELDVVVTYHETQEEANSGVNAFASPYTNIVINEQILFVRVTNTITGCFNASETLLIRVLEIPQVSTELSDYIICDSDSNGFAQFDLTSKDDEIIGSQVNVTLTYHTNEADAITGNNPITNTASYTNNSNPQTIYVRLENDTNDCYDIGTFQISVELPPEAVQPTPLEVCDDEVADEITVFDLTIKNDEITGGNGSWSVSYYETQDDAEAQSNVIADPTQYTNTSVDGAEANPQTLYAVVTDTNTGCTDMVTLTIRVQPNPTPTLVLPAIELCDVDNAGDGVEPFDLTENEVLLLNGEANVSASYYEDADDADAGTNAIADPTAYVNTATPQTIYVRVTNDITGCYALVDFTIIVNP